MSAPTTGPTAQALSTWLAERIAGYLQRETAEIDPTVPLAEYGLDSVAALSLCGDIEEDFEIMVEPTVAWDYPTVQALTGHLLEEFAAGPGAA